MSVTVASHPLVHARLSTLRQTSTTAKGFREGIHDISLFLAIEASKDLETETFTGQTPIREFTGSVIKPRVAMVPILRAGLGMTDALVSLFPNAPVYHIGIFREQISLQPVEYYSKLPANPAVDMVYLLDPLIATGGTACAALNMIVGPSLFQSDDPSTPPLTPPRFPPYYPEWGIPASKIRLLCVLASQTGLDEVRSQFPDLNIWTAGIDPELTDKGLIAPGLGDTGDRLFSTVRP